MVEASIENELWRRLQGFLSRYSERKQEIFPLTDLEAALLMSTIEAKKQGFYLNQQQLAFFLGSDEVTVSETIKGLVKRRLCKIRKIVGKRGNYPQVTRVGTETLLEYARLKFSDATRVFGNLSKLPEYQVTTREMEKVIDADLKSKFEIISY